MSEKIVNFDDRDTICYLKNCIVSTDTISLSECKNLWIGENRDIRKNPDGPMIGLLPLDCEFTPGWQNEKTSQKKDNLAQRILNLDSDEKELIMTMISVMEQKKEESKVIQKRRKLQI